MPTAFVRGVNLNYEILGESGPCVAWTPGGRNSLEQSRLLATHLAGAGYRVIIHDRRNCGASDVSFAGEESEADI